jgi:hypothetical protein
MILNLNFFVIKKVFSCKSVIYVQLCSFTHKQILKNEKRELLPLVLLFERYEVCESVRLLI